MEDLKFEAKDSDGLVQYLKVHPEVTDVLFTGGDPMVMRTRVLRRFIEPLLSPELEHVKNIRIGTKAVAYWPQRFVSDEDADDLLRLFEEVVASGRQLAIMGHYSHPVELAPEISRQAISRIRSTGAQIRMQAPLIRHVNDNAESWAELWRTGVNLGLIPYYMFVERDTGARNYFEVPLIRAYDIFREAYGSVSGLARTVRGPSMSTFPGKVRIHGILRMHELMEPATLQMLHDNFSYSSYDPSTPLMLCDFIQARNPEWVKRPFVAEFDEDASWLTDLRPAFGRSRFYFQDEGDAADDFSQLSLTELLLE
jgi:L-lysine 2,3-aminomutase